MLRKIDVKMSNAISRARKTTHKYCVVMPTNIEHAKMLDTKNGKTFWIDVIKTEAHDVGIVFEILDGNVSMSMGIGRLHVI